MMTTKAKLARMGRPRKHRAIDTPLWTWWYAHPPGKRPTMPWMMESFAVSRTTVHGWLDGSRRPSYDKIVLIAEATNGRVPAGAWSAMPKCRRFVKKRKGAA